MLLLSFKNRDDIAGIFDNMDQGDKDVIRTNIGVLSDDMDFESVSSFLYSRRIFEKGHIEAFAANRTQKQKNLELLLAIETRGPEAFCCLVEALLAAKQPYLAEILGYLPAAHSRELVQVSTPDEPFLPSQADSGGSLFHWMDSSTSDVPSDKVYKMSSKPKGIAFIINNKNFTEMSDRAGTDVDCRNLEKIFGDLGFSVTTNHNLKGEEMERKIRELSKCDHSQYDCVVLAILTHGTEGAVYGIDGIYDKDEGLVMIEDIISLFNADRCPTLKGKPKLFFVQACRGGGYDAGVEAPDGFGPTGDRGSMCDLEKEVQILLPTEVDSTDGLGSVKCKIPSQSDMLLGYSTVPGLVSWRNSENGSWFVQGLTKIIKQHARGEDLVSMMTMVNDKVSSFESNNTGRYKQASVYVSSLLKKLYFFPGHAR